MKLTKRSSKQVGQASIAVASVLAASYFGSHQIQAATHVVQPGDSFFGIASRYGMNPYDLATNNGKTINSLINPGEVLQVASPAPVTSTHTVQAGESFYSIASYYGMDVYALAANNGKTINDLLQVGDVLQVETSAQVAPAYQAPASTGEVILNTPTTHGNSFPIGQCTWAVKELAPWVNNWWGNAKDWANNAAIYNGFSVGTTPAVGAIAVWDGGEYGHVAYVTSVQSNNSIQVLEANYLGQQQIANYRGWFDPTTAQGNVSYIYPW